MKQIIVSLLLLTSWVNAQDIGFALHRHEYTINPNMKCRFFEASYDFDTGTPYNDSSYAHWYKSDIIYLLNDSGSVQERIEMSNDYTFTAIRKAFNEWNTNNPTRITLTEGDSTTSVRKAVDSLNVIQWTTDIDILEDEKTVAIAWFTSDTTGRIYDCDIFFNDYPIYLDQYNDPQYAIWHCPYPYFDLNDDTMLTPSDYDLQSIATHEIGHMLGLGHGDVTLFNNDYPNNPSSMVCGDAWRFDTSYSRRCNTPDGWYDDYPHTPFEMRTIEYWDTAGVNFLYGNILNVPYVFSNVEEAVAFADSGQRITLVWGYHSSSQCNIQDVVSIPLVLKAGVPLDITYRTSMVIEDTVIIEKGNRIKLTGQPGYAADVMPEIIFKNEGTLIVRDPYGLRGMGNLINPNIHWECDFRLPAGDSLIFIMRDTSRFVFDFDSSRQMILDGKVEFICERDSAIVTFDSLLARIELNESRSGFKVHDKITLDYLPVIEADTGSILWFEGSPGPGLVYAKFRPQSYILNYGTFLAQYTEFKASESHSSDLTWEGITSASEYSYLDMNYCSVNHIYTEALSNAYHAISIIGTGAERFNHIRNSEIISTLDVYPPHRNHAVYLYPGYSAGGDEIPAYLQIDSTCIYRDWEYAITNYHGYHESTACHIFGNLNGVVVDEAAAQLDSDCITYHDWIGLLVDNNSTVVLKEASQSGGAFVAIKEAGIFPVQGFKYPASICVDNASSITGGKYSGNPPTIIDGANSIYGSGSYAIVGSNNSSVEMVGNYWGNPASPRWDYGCVQFDVGDELWSEPSETTGCDSSCVSTGTSDSGTLFETEEESAFLRDSDHASGIQKTTSRSMYKQQFKFLKNALQGGVPANAYSIANSMLSSVGNSIDAYAIGAKLFQRESSHSRIHPDSLQECMFRVGSFLNSQISTRSNTEVKNALRYYLARTYAQYADFASAKAELNLLLNSGPTTHLKKSALLVKQNIAVATRDTNTVEQTLAELYALDSTAHETAIAAAARQIFYKLREGAVQQRSLNLPKYASERSTAIVPMVISLEQNIPNPFNPSTEITYGIPVDTHVKLTVFDNLGQEIQVLTNGWKDAGTYTVTFEAADLPSGMYLYRIETANGSVSKKMMLMK